MDSNSFIFSRTKITTPKRRAEILTRTRLLELSYELLDKKLILISAPAGYGKTSLLIDLAYHSEMPLCWLSLDALDQDPQRFITYLIASINNRYPKFGKQSNTALSNLTSVEDDLEQLVTTMANEILEQIPEHFAIILDDYQFVDGIPAIRNFVNKFVQVVNENCHILLSARTLITLPDLPLLLGQDQVGGLSFLELAFQEDEFQALMQQNHHRTIPPDLAKELIKKTEGWITALQLSGLEIEEEAEAILRVTRSSGMGLSNYIMEQVLDKQPQKLREFLLDSSLLDEFNADLCESVLGILTPGRPRNWKKLIESILQNNLFALPVGPDGKWLRYHHIFQEVLRKQLEVEHPERVALILRRLAQVYEENGDQEKAFHTLQLIGNIRALADFVERRGSSLINQDRLITLASWLEALPEFITEERPLLLALKGSSAVLRGDVQLGLLILTRAEEALRSTGDTPHLALTLMRKAFANRHLGKYTDSLADADEVLKLTETESNQKTIRFEAMRVKGLSLYRLGQIGEATRWLSEALALCSEVNEASSIPRIEMELGMAYRAAGNYALARQYYEKALSLWRKEGNLFWQSNLLNNMGVMLHFQGEYDKAVPAFEEGLSCARRSGYLRMQALNLASMGDLYKELEEYDAAQRAYRQSQEISERIEEQFLLRYLALAQAGIARLCKEYLQAYLLLDQVREQIENGNSNYEKGILHLENGQVLCAEGKFQAAVDSFKLAQSAFSEGGLWIENTWSQLWLAAAYNQFGEVEKARESLCNALNLVKADQPITPLVMAARQVRGWLPDLGTATIEKQKYLDLLEKAKGIDTSLPALRKRLRPLISIIHMSLPRLTIQTLGKSHVKVNGKAVSPSQWQTQSVREMFFYFLTAKVKVSKEVVGTAFWPEATPAQVKLRFKNNIFRLRRALGQDIILFENDQYQFNCGLDYDLDVENFNSYLTQARTAKDARVQIECYESALSLVHGSYLEDIDAEWLIIERERIKQEHLSALLRLASLLKDAGKLDRALQTCERALAVDRSLEDAHCLMMNLYATAKDRNAVIRQYKQLKDFLRELGLAPTPDTERLYQQLIH